MNNKYIDRNFFRNVSGDQKFKLTVREGLFNIYDYVHSVLVSEGICTGTETTIVEPIYVPKSVLNGIRDIDGVDTIDIQYIVKYILQYECSGFNFGEFYRKEWSKEFLQLFLLPSSSLSPTKASFNLKQEIINIAVNLGASVSTVSAELEIIDNNLILVGRSTAGCVNCGGTLEIRENDSLGQLSYFQSYACDVNGDINDNNDSFEIGGLPDGTYYVSFTITDCTGSDTATETYIHVNPNIVAQTLSTPEDTPLVIDFNTGSTICTGGSFRIDSVSNGTMNESLNTTGLFTFTPNNNFVGTATINATLICSGVDASSTTITIDVQADDLNVVTFLPANSGVNIDSNVTMVLTYNDGRILSSGVGNIVITETSGPTVVKNVPASDADVTLLNNTVTITNLGLSTSEDYDVLIQADFVQDQYGNSCREVLGTAYGFSTSASPNSPPVALATTSGASNGIVPFEVTFDGSGSTDDTGIASYAWDFIDGGSATGVGPTYTFVNSGTFNVELTVTDTDGATDTDTVTVNAYNGATASFTRVQSGLEVTFTDTSTAGSLSITNWDWDFGDTNVSTLQNPVHTYAADGTYTVELTTTDSGGFQDTVSIQITVAATSSPTYQCLSWTATQLTIDPATCNVNSNISTTTGWNNNGAYTNTSPGTSSDDISIRFTHNTGRYSCGLASLGDRSFYYQQTFEYGIYITGTTANPVINGIYNPTSTSFSVPSGAVVEVAKSGNSIIYSVDGIVQHTGTYTPPGSPIDVYGKISARNTPHSQDAVQIQSGVAVVTPPTANYTYSVNNLEVTLTDNSTAGSSVINTYEWDFGDATTSTQQNPVKTFASAGTYNVQLTVTDASNETDTYSEMITVTAAAGPTANYNAAVSNLNVAFTDTSIAGNSAITTWAWDFDDGTTSAQQNPQHTFTSAGTYNVSLTVTDGNLIQDTYTTGVTVSTSASDIDTIISRWSEDNRDRDQGDLPSASIAAIIADQETAGHFGALGAQPTSSTSASIRYLWDWCYYLRKLTIDYRFGSFTGTSGDATTRATIWRALKGMSDNITNLRFYSRGTWTPMGWWVPLEFSRIFCTISDAYGSFNAETIDGVAVSTFVPALVDNILGATNMVKDAGFTGWHDISMTGSIDNVRGNNQIARQTQMQGVAAFAAKHSGDTTGISQIKTKIENNFTIGAGLVFVEEENEYSGWVGINPKGGYGAHNSAAGIQDQICNYGRVTLRNHADYVRRSRGTVYEHSSGIYDFIVTLCRELARAFVRGRNSLISEGREGLRVANGGNDYGTFGAGAVAFVMQPYLDFANLTTQQRTDITTYEASVRRAAVFPNYNSTNYMWAQGTAVYIGGVAGSEYSSRWRVAKRRDVAAGIAGMAHVEQAIGDTPNLFVTEGSWFGMGHDVDEDNFSEAFGQFVSMIGAYPFEAPHGTTNSQNPDDNAYRLRANSNNNPTDNDLAGGADYDNRFLVAGHYKSRTNVVSKANAYSTKFAFERSDNRGYVFHLESGISSKNSPVGDIVTNSVDPFDRDIVFNFDSTSGTRTAGTYGTNTYTNPSYPWVWYRATPTHPTYTQGKGTMWIGTVPTLRTVFSTETRTNDYLRGGMGGSTTGQSLVMSNVHGNPVTNASAAFVDIFRISTSAEMDTLRTNWDNNFAIYNTTDYQCVVDKVDEVAQFIVWNASGATVPIEVDAGGTTLTSCTVNKPCVIIAEKNGASWDVTYADADWQVQAAAKAVDITISGLTAALAQPFATIALPDRGPLYPAGSYTGGGQTTINIS